MQFDANLHEKTRAKIEEKLAAGFVFDAEKWKAGAEPKEAAAPDEQANHVPGEVEEVLLRQQTLSVEDH